MSSNSNFIAHRLCTFGKFLKLFICGIEKVMLSFSGNLKEKMNWHRIVSVASHTGSVRARLYQFTIKGRKVLGLGTVHRRHQGKGG